MLWRKLKKFFPSREHLHKHPYLSWLGKRLHDPRLWRWERSAVAGGAGLGLFAAFIPIPIQMVWGALLAFYFRVNLPTAVAMTCINNPFTFIPINFFIYKVGTWIVGNNTVAFQMPNWEWGKETLFTFWNELLGWFPVAGRAYLVGFLIVSLGSAILGYLLVDFTWRLTVFFRKLRLR